MPFKLRHLLQRLSTPMWLICLGIMMSSCVGLGSTVSPTPTTANPPQLEVPATVRQACDLYRLPPSNAGHPLTWADLEVGYATRGAQLVVCNSQRELAVGIIDREHAAEQQWLQTRARRNCPWYRFGTCRAPSY